MQLLQAPCRDDVVNQGACGLDFIFEFLVKLGKIKWALDYVTFVFFDELADGMAAAPEAFTGVRMLAVHVRAAHWMPIFVILASTCSYV